jgi:hypothetical protein
MRRIEYLQARPQITPSPLCSFGSETWTRLHPSGNPSYTHNYTQLRPWLIFCGAHCRRLPLPPHGSRSRRGAFARMWDTTVLLTKLRCKRDRASIGHVVSLDFQPFRCCICPRIAACANIQEDSNWQASLRWVRTENLVEGRMLRTWAFPRVRQHIRYQY